MNSLQWYTAQFPESMFLSSSQNQRNYAECVMRGRDIALESNVLICGIARNVEKILPYTLARIETLGSFFQSYGTYIFENDSTDRTLNVLKKWASEKDNRTVESERFDPPPFTDPRGRIRRHYMARARNKYLDFIRFVSLRSLIDYVIIVDMDLLGGWSYHGVLNSLGQPTYWDMIGSNSLCYIEHEKEWHKLFYDSWAFRPLDHPKAIEDQEANLFIFNRGEAMIKVNSCFGGLGIYKTHCMTEDFNYTDEDCDHPTLHNELVKKGYQIFLNPSQITLYNKSQYVI